MHNKITATKNPLISLFPLFLLSSKKIRFLATSASDEPASLEFRASALINAVFDELPVSSASNVEGISEMEKDILNSFLGQGLRVFDRINRINGIREKGTEYEKDTLYNSVPSTASHHCRQGVDGQTFRRSISPSPGPSPLFLWKLAGNRSGAGQRRR